MDLPLHVTQGGTGAGSILRSNQAYLELLSTKTTLDWGIAFSCDQFPDLPDAHQFREVWIENAADAPKALAAVDAFFAERDAVCARWVLAEAQPPEPIEPTLTMAGYRRHDRMAMVLTEWPDISAPKEVRVLPARPMRAAYRAGREDAGGFIDAEFREEFVEAANERLDDHRIDAFVAMIGKEPAGTCTLFQVGDIGRLIDLHVHESFRRRGVGAALASHVVALARRLMMRTVCIEISSRNSAGLAFLKKIGFVEGGRIIEFDHPTAQRPEYER